MPKYTFGKTEDKSPADKFGVPAGSYVARFEGTEEVKPFSGPSKFGGQDQGPRMAWRFRVLEPATHRGKLFTQFSSEYSPSPRSNFMKVLSGLLGRLPAEDEEVNTDALVGRSYRVEVGVNPISDVGNLHIAYMAPAGTPPPAAAKTPAPPVPTADEDAPPPPPPPPPLAAWYWLLLPDGSSVKKQVAEVIALFNNGTLETGAPCLQLPSKQGGWRSAEALGLGLPF